MTNKTKMLCIDDDRNILNIFKMYFERENYTVLLAEDGEKGLKIFEAQKPDIVLVDLRMPNVDGFEVLERINRETTETPVLVISGEGEIEDVIRAIRLGAWDYQTKPIRESSTDKRKQVIPGGP